MHGTRFLVIAALLSLAACGGRDGDLAKETNVPRDTALTITGELVHRARIALPPDSRAVVELRGSSRPEVVVAETSMVLAGGQVPVPFELTVDRSAVADAQSYTLRGAIYSMGLPAWVSEPVAIATSASDVAVGTVELRPFEEPLTETRWRCGDHGVAIDFAGPAARLQLGDETFALRRAVSASGAKYEALGDATTYVWNKGDRTTVAVRGESYPECAVVSAASGTFRALGNEPGWSVEIGPDESKLVTDYGASTITFATPEPEVAGESLVYVAESSTGPLTVTILPGPCHDAMSGMPFPRTVTVEHTGGTLRGCGGEPRELLLGKEWIVDQIAGKGLVRDSRITIGFTPEGRVAGTASCNTYTGAYVLTGEGLTFGDTAVTMKMCVPDLSAQEEAFLKTLVEVHRFEIAGDGVLLLHTADGRSIRARRD